MTPEVPTLGEIMRVLERVEEAQTDLSRKVDVTFVRRDVYDSDNALRTLVQTQTEAWQNAHIEAHRWLVRTIGAAVLVTLSNIIIILLGVKP